MLAGIPLHLVQRGNNRAACFFSDEDRSFYLFHLDRLLQPSGCALHAYCLMTNHVHLLLTAGSPDSCARLMKQVLACYRYIELNPVRAGLCMHRREHAWSSFASNGEGRFDSRITPHDEYLRLGQNKDERTQAYLELLRAELSAERLEEIRQATNGNVVLGREPFRRQIAAALGRRATRGTPGRRKTWSVPDFVAVRTF